MSCSIKLKKDKLSKIINKLDFFVFRAMEQKGISFYKISQNAKTAESVEILDKVRRGEYTREQLQDIVEMKTNNINSQLVWNWQQAYVRLAVSCNVDVSKFKLPCPTDRDLEMFTAFCQYNQARNKYIRESKWPNYYEWLKENRFDGKTSDEIFDELNY
jgi:hypothetical protein